MVHILLRTTPFLLLGAACVTTAARRAAVNPSLPPVEQGKALYETSCNRCHALHMPSSYYADEWAFYVRKYGRKARLSAEERDLVFYYLETQARRE
jgi:cytochrome c5